MFKGLLVILPFIALTVDAAILARSNLCLGGDGGDSWCVPAEIKVLNGGENSFRVRLTTDEEWDNGETDEVDVDTNLMLQYLQARSLSQRTSFRIRVER